MVHALPDGGPWRTKVLDEIKAIATLTGSPMEEAPGNRLLASLPSGDLVRLAPYRATVQVAAGETLVEPGAPAHDVLFPSGPCVLSLLALLPDRKPVETLMVGAEGATGALLGDAEGPFGFRVQALTAGPVIRIPATAFALALDSSPGLRRTIARYAAAQLAQAQIGVACAALHPVEARAARWMLDLQARLGDRALPLTQEALADLLGVRRTTITRVVATLEARGVVRHRRGRIIVMDREGLAAAACACHDHVRSAFDARIPGLFPAPESPL